MIIFASFIITSTIFSLVGLISVTTDSSVSVTNAPVAASSIDDASSSLSFLFLATLSCSIRRHRSVAKTTASGNAVTSRQPDTSHFVSSLNSSSDCSAASFSVQIVAGRPFTWCSKILAAPRRRAPDTNTAALTEQRMKYEKQGDLSVCIRMYYNTKRCRPQNLFR